MSDSLKKKQPLLEVLVERALAASKDQARALIMAGKVVVNSQRVDKSGTQVRGDADIRVKQDSRYVGRGGDKLLSAIQEFKLESELSNTVALDIGASTGGFTDCLLEHGAELVIALDVGTNQLAWKLRNDPRVKCIEKTDIRDFKAAEFPVVEWVVGDISFNSLARLAPFIISVVNNPKAKYLLLVKPQFELDRFEIPDGGIVEDESLQLQAVEKVKASFIQLGYQCDQHVKSKLRGRNGNQEYFILVTAK